MDNVWEYFRGFTLYIIRAHLRKDTHRHTHMYRVRTHPGIALNVININSTPWKSWNSPWFSIHHWKSKFTVNILKTTANQAGISDLTSSLDSCQNNFFVGSISKTLSKLGRRNARVKMTRRVMCCHLVYEITSAVINRTACYRILHELGFLKHIHTKGTHTYCV